MRYAKIKHNDTVDGIGLCVSLWTQGCPIHCFNCHNPETWDFNGGLDAPYEQIESEILNALTLHGIHRNFSILGGEPLCQENLFLTTRIIKAIKEKVDYQPLIFLWSGYTYEVLFKTAKKNEQLQYVLDNIDCLVSGPYIDQLRDITLQFCGSSNQEVRYFNNLAK